MDQKIQKINSYVLKIPNYKRQASEKRNISKYEIIKKHHKFIRDSDSQDQKEKVKSKEEQFVKLKYEQLYKQYALVDLTKYQTAKIGCRWRTQKEVIKSKGQNICANIKCQQPSVSIYQMNFAYLQQNQKKNALVKVSVCNQCAIKLNFSKQLKQVKLKKQDKKIVQDKDLVKIEAAD